MKIYDFIKENFGPESIIFEIGIHHGEDTKRIFELTQAKIHAFEPDPRNIQFIANSNLEEFCKFNPVAVSGSSGYSDFFLSSGRPNDPNRSSEEWSLSSSLKTPKDHIDIHPWCKFEDSIRVPTITIDEYIKKESINQIDFIWMDVQGAEDLVFAGMNDSKKITKFIFTEYCEDGIELYESAPTKNKILDILGSEWEILFDFGNTGLGIDVLLRNKLFK